MARPLQWIIDNAEALADYFEYVDFTEAPCGPGGEWDAPARTVSPEENKMDSSLEQFRSALIGAISIWISTDRDGDPYVRIPASQIEGVLNAWSGLEAERDELQLRNDALTAERDAALYQMRANATRMDAAEAKLWRAE